jgi:hypothetical protein
VSDGPKLRGAAAESHAASEAQREADARQRAEDAEDRRALARVVALTVGRLLNAPPDQALAVVAGTDARRVLAMAGMAPAQAPAPRQAPAAGPPDDDPRVVAAVLRRASAAEVAAIKREVAAEHREEPRQESPEMWRTASGEMLTDDTLPRPQRQVSRPYPARSGQ